ncbi:MAG: hypothetical protein ACOYLB_14975 [Phototrophicaceae bacterium]
MTFILYVLFLVVQLGTYLAIRRQLLPLNLIAGVGIFASIVLVMLIGLVQGSVGLQAFLVGMVLGALLNALTLGTAWYFQRQA